MRRVRSHLRRVRQQVHDRVEQWNDAHFTRARSA